MLVLSRHEMEAIEIQDATGNVIASVVVVQVRCKRGNHPKVQIGIDAGDEVRIFRREVAEARRREEKATV